MRPLAHGQPGAAVGVVRALDGEELDPHPHRVRVEPHPEAAGVVLGDRLVDEAPPLTDRLLRHLDEKGQAEPEHLAEDELGCGGNHGTAPTAQQQRLTCTAWNDLGGLVQFGGEPRSRGVGDSAAVHGGEVERPVRDQHGITSSMAAHPLRCARAALCTSCAAHEQRCTSCAVHELRCARRVLPPSRPCPRSDGDAHAGSARRSRQDPDWTFRQ
ncbi:MAG: hypothetical protein PUE00_03575 [Thermobifida fusca]|nr:hypothetical protein [Thermobifida fusca]